MEEAIFIPITESQSLKIEDRNKQETSIFLYFTTCVVTTLSIMTLGLMVVWISPVAPKLQSDDPEVNPLSRPITTFQLSVLASLPAVGFILGPFLLAGISDKLGRRSMLMIIGSLSIVAMIALAFATDVPVICIELALTITFLGAAYSGATMYLSEISDGHDRAKIASIGSCGLPLGNFMCYVFSSNTSSVRDFTLISTVPAAVCLPVMFLYLPETPVYLASRGRLDEASLALRKLRNKTEEGLQQELRSIVHVLEETAGSGRARFGTLFTDAANRRALWVALGVHLLSFSCGSFAMMSYLTAIFDRAGERVSIEFATILLTSVQMVAVGGATQMVGKFGRRTLLMWSTIVCTLALFSLGLFFRLKGYEVGFVEHIAWWPLGAMMVFYVSISLGVAPLGWIITSELFPSDVMPAALSIVILGDGIGSFASTFAFPMVMEALGIHWVFWGFSGAFFLGILFVHFVVPETRGKNLLEIRKMLMSKSLC